MEKGWEDEAVVDVDIFERGLSLDVCVCETVAILEASGRCKMGR